MFNRRWLEGPGGARIRPRGAKKDKRRQKITINLQNAPPRCQGQAWPWIWGRKIQFG